MAFSIDQLERLRIRAGLMVNGMKDLLVRQWSFEETRQIVEDQLKEVWTESRSIALDEVRSTPWEWRTLFVPAGAHRNEACEQAMNAYSEAGWELYMVTIDRQFWRRRRAVRELEAKSV